MIQRNHEYFISKCITLAKKSIGQVSPNPLVGSILVKNNKIVARGWHKKSGCAHAEVDAISKYQGNFESIILYCNLEPCCHTNKLTPPCVELIISKGIKNVVIGCFDPNPSVSGKGVLKLRSSGINVITGILKEKCEELNQIFLKSMTSQFPYIHLKMATTLNGKIAKNDGSLKWITNEKSRIEVHKLRLEYDGIVVGINTVLADNPKLNIRMGVKSKDKTPYKIIFGFHINIFNSYLFQDNLNKVIIFSSKIDDQSLSKLKKNNIKYFNTSELYKALVILRKMGITSILIEGGSILFSSFLNENMFDKISIFMAPKLISDGVDLCSNNFNDQASFNLKNIKFSILDDNILTEGINNVYRSC